MLSRRGITRLRKNPRERRTMTRGHETRNRDFSNTWQVTMDGIFLKSFSSLLSFRACGVPILLVPLTACSNSYADVAFIPPKETPADYQMILDMRAANPQAAHFFGGLDENGVGALCAKQADEIGRWYLWRARELNVNTQSTAYATLLKEKEEHGWTSEKETLAAAAIRYVFSLPLPGSNGAMSLERQVADIKHHWGYVCSRNFRWRPVLGPESK